MEKPLKIKPRLVDQQTVKEWETRRCSACNKILPSTNNLWTVKLDKYDVFNDDVEWVEVRICTRCKKTIEVNGGSLIVIREGDEEEEKKVMPAAKLKGDLSDALW